MYNKNLEKFLEQIKQKNMGMNRTSENSAGVESVGKLRRSRVGACRGASRRKACLYRKESRKDAVCV